MLNRLLFVTSAPLAKQNECRANAGKFVSQHLALELSVLSCQTHCDERASSLEA